MFDFPKWCYIFITICFLIPILMIESIVPWAIFLYFSYKCIKASQNSSLHFKSKLIKCLTYSLIAWVLGYTFNFMVVKGTSFLFNNIF